MTDKEKLEKIKKLADAMYYTAFNMTTDASLLRKAMNEYHQFIIYKYHKEEPVSEEWIKELRTKLDSMSKEDFKKVFDKYAVDFNEEPVSEELEGASKEWLKPQLDKSYESYGEGKMMELTHFDGYAMLDAIEFGAKWQKEQFEKDYTNLCKGIATAKGLAVAMAYDKGMADAREQMMANSADAMIGLPYENKDGGYTHLVDISRPLPVGNNKIAIIFKEE